MATQKLYAWAHETATDDVVLNEMIFTLINCSDFVCEDKQDALQEIDEWFEETCEMSTEPKEDNYIIYEIKVSVVPKKLVRKEGVIRISTNVKDIES